MKRIRYVGEAALAVAGYAMLRVMPLDKASDFGGWLARKLGPHLRVHRVAQHNIATAMPQLSEAQRANIMRGMWDNLGRIFCEYAHLSTRRFASRIAIASGQEYVKQALESKRSIVFISAHIGNWECLPVAAHRQQAPVHLLYRPANNPLTEWLVQKLRTPHSPHLHAKGMKGARAVLQALKKQQHVALLMDQKANDGIAVDFMGTDAMTTPSAAQLALKHQVILLPCYCLRGKGAEFAIHIEAPITWEQQPTRAQTIRHITERINSRIEAWVRANPSQWFWVHKRWPHSTQA